MARFHRDYIIKNVTIGEETIIEINALFTETLLNIEDGDNYIYYYVIRFDNKGYNVFIFDDLMKYFRQAKYVERVIFTIELKEDLYNLRKNALFVGLNLDQKEQNNCNLAVTSENNTVVESIFFSVKEILDKNRNRNNLLRNIWTLLAIQIIGVILGFCLSLWGASIITPKLNVSNPFIISFIFILLIFSNIWTHIFQLAIRGLNNLFPNLRFQRHNKNRLRNLLKTVVVGVSVTVIVYILSFVFDFIGNVISTILNN